jgi:hypothetical protein
MNPHTRANHTGYGMTCRHRRVRSLKRGLQSSLAPRFASLSFAFRAWSFYQVDGNTFFPGAANPVVDNIARERNDSIPIAATVSGAA